MKWYLEREVDSKRGLKKKKKTLLLRYNVWDEMHIAQMCSSVIFTTKHTE